ncbi:MAG: ribosome rescue protein RqcH [Candidatus Kariarchaeaceae archaeon]|jgi:predicted ribosome quality control (RQC) complex YloA/Tae2 family protein
MALSGIDVRVLVNELSKEIIGSWIVNIYQIPERIFIFKLRKPQQGLQFLLIEPGKRIHLTQFNRIMPKTPSNFTKSLRSHLRDRRINSIIQRDIDRIIVLNIGPDEGSSLIVELFGEGNLILVSPTMKIISAIWYRRMRDRDIHPGKIFVQMPAQENDVLRDDKVDIRICLSKHPKIVPALNTCLGLGPYYSRYLLKKSRITKKRSDQIEDHDITNLTSAIFELKNRLINHDYSPVVYLEKEQGEEGNDQGDLAYDEQWEDVSLPFLPENVVKILPWKQPVSDEENMDIMQLQSLNQALDIFYSSQERHENLSEESVELETEGEKLNRLLELQQTHQRNLLNQAETHRLNADALYSHFQPGDELISTIYEARKKKMSWEDIENRLVLGKTKGLKSASLFHSLLINEAKLRMVLPFEEKDVEVDIDFRLSLTENANQFYKLAKRAQKKAKGADIAINLTNEKIRSASQKVAEIVDDNLKKVIILKRRKMWYEKFHWTKSQNGSLIITGFDASSNERLVKRYLDEDDLFMHADIQGAAATIIKFDGKEVSENTLRSAALMSVSFSSAWKAERPMADAFYVESDQVSLSPPSGEFLPKGSFMIYGEKQFVKNIDVEIYLGLVVEKNWARIISGTADVKNETNFWVKLTPGDIPKGKIAKSMKNKFTKSSSPEDIEKIKALDIGEFAWAIPGNSHIVEWSN